MACAVFEDYFRARPVLCKHLPSVWAQFELCLGLIYEGLDVFLRKSRIFGVRLGATWPAAKFLFARAWTFCVSQLSACVARSATIWYGISGSVAMAAVCLRTNRAGEVSLFCLDEEWRSPTLG